MAASAISKKKEAVQLPEDMVVEILRRLPVKSPVRFRCACKTWYSVISHPKFPNKLHCLLISKRYSKTVTIDSLMNEKTAIQSAPIYFPWLPEGFYPEFLGSCKGLVCLKTFIYRDDLSPPLTTLILWNPAMRNYRKLPSPSRVPDRFDHNTYAVFGYDESVDDYKFVWMKFKDPKSRPSMIEFDAFPLKSNTWRSYDHCLSSDIILYPTNWHRQNPVLINGAIHRVTHYEAGDSSGIRILAFDLALDKFTLLEPPRERGLDRSYVVSLSGCLCLCVCTEDLYINLWMMKEYGVSSSWLKLVSIPKISTLLHTCGIIMFDPILFSNEEGKIVAVIDYLSVEHGHYKRKIMRLQVEEGAVVKAKTLLSEYNYTDYVFLPMEERLVSLN